MTGDAEGAGSEAESDGANVPDTDSEKPNAAPERPDSGFVDIDVECGDCGFRLLGSGTQAPDFCAGCGVLLTQRAEPHRAPDIEMSFSRPSGPTRVLVVDDSSVLRRLVAGIVRASGNEALEARSGAEALRMMADAIPDLVITDNHMPRMTGFQMIEKMREDPNLHPVKVVMLSLESGSAIIRRAKELKVLDFIRKDDFYDPSDLKGRLAKFLMREI